MLGVSYYRNSKFKTSLGGAAPPLPPQHQTSKHSLLITNQMKRNTSSMSRRASTWKKIGVIHERLKKRNGYKHISRYF